MTGSTSRRSARSALVAALLGIVLGGCKVEEDLRIAGDGSGAYNARVTVSSEFAEALSKLRDEGPQKGFRIVDEGQEGGDRFLVVGKDFSEIGQLDDDEDSYTLEIERTSILRGTYRLTADLGANLAASGFERLLRVEMPVPITEASAGTVEGSTVVWDASAGGRLVVEAAGFALPVSRRERWAVWSLAALLPVALVAVRVRRRVRAAPCGGCGAPLPAGARFCAACGTAR